MRTIARATTVSAAAIVMTKRGSTEAPDQRLDYVLVPTGSEVLLVDTPEGGDAWRAISDHLPVLVEFR